MGLRETLRAGRFAALLDRLDEAQRPFRLVNYQGKFSSMHDFRWEPIVEGSNDGGATWRQFPWRYKLNSGPTCTEMTRMMSHTARVPARSCYARARKKQIRPGGARGRALAAPAAARLARLVPAPGREARCGAAAVVSAAAREALGAEIRAVSPAGVRPVRET